MIDKHIPFPVDPRAPKRTRFWIDLAAVPKSNAPLIDIIGTMQETGYFIPMFNAVEEFAFDRISARVNRLRRQFPE